MDVYEIWESDSTFVLVESDHEEKITLIRGCTLVISFEASDWYEAQDLARSYRIFGIKALEMHTST